MDPRTLAGFEPALLGLCRSAHLIALNDHSKHYPWTVLEVDVLTSTGVEPVLLCSSSLPQRRCTPQDNPAIRMGCSGAYAVSRNRTCVSHLSRRALYHLAMTSQLWLRGYERFYCLSYAAVMMILGRLNLLGKSPSQPSPIF